MPDLLSVQPVTGLGAAMRPTPPAPEPKIAEPADSGASGSAQNYQGTKDGHTIAQETRHANARRRAPGDVLTGPPPSFEASLLELEGDLETIIKRLDAARELARETTKQATSPSGQSGPSGDETATSSEHDISPGTSSQHSRASAHGDQGPEALGVAPLALGQDAMAGAPEMTA